MRRKSTRGKAKSAGDDGVQIPASRRSTRTRRRKKSESSSDQDSESEEEVMPTPKTRRAVAPPPEERVVPSTPSGSRTRRSSRRAETIVEEVKTLEPVAEADVNADRDSNGSNETEADSSTVWKVQNSNGSGSGITKLKLCRSGPVEQPEVLSPRRRRGAREPEVQTVIEVEERVAQRLQSDTLAQPSPTPEPDSSGLTAKAQIVTREEEESKGGDTTSSSSSSSSSTSSSSSEKSRSSTPEKVESEPVEEEDDDDDEKAEEVVNIKDVDDKDEEEEEEEEEDEDEEEVQVIKDDTPEDSNVDTVEDSQPEQMSVEAPSDEEATSVDVPSENTEDVDPLSVQAKAVEEVESSSPEVEEKLQPDHSETDKSAPEPDVISQQETAAPETPSVSLDKVVEQEGTSAEEGTTRILSKTKSADVASVSKSQDVVEPECVKTVAPVLGKPLDTKSAEKDEVVLVDQTEKGKIESEGPQEVASASMVTVAKNEPVVQEEVRIPEVKDNDFKAEKKEIKPTEIHSDSLKETSQQPTATLPTPDLKAPQDTVEVALCTSVEDEEQSDDEAVVDLAPGSPVEADQEMAEAEAEEAKEAEKALGARRRPLVRRQASSRSSSSDSDGPRQRKKKRTSSEDSDRKPSHLKRSDIRRGQAPEKETKITIEPVKVEVVKEEPAPPTRLRRQPPSMSERSEKVTLKRAVSGHAAPGEDAEKVVHDSADQGALSSSLDDNKENPDTVVVNEEETKSTEQPMIRKRRWGSCKSIKKTVLCISSDPLKNLIPDAKPVAESEVHLTLEEEGELIDEDERTIKLERSKERIVVDRPLPPPTISLPETSRIVLNTLENVEDKKLDRKISIASESSRAASSKSPTPSKNRLSTILYITNLVRPFTVGQLRELLSRTGKIVEFWINGIKSQCFVEYENEDQAIETRHALHGVHWPISNRKALHVEFGKKEDMQKAQAETEADIVVTRKAYQPSDILSREGKDFDEKLQKTAPSVREWDLGKLHDASNPDSRDPSYEERKKREEERRVRKEKRSLSPSHEGPARKIKKPEEAPAKLLDDLFRKTKTTPCIYWLPLTPQQISEKEEMRRKHMAEHERIRAEMRKAHERNMQRGRDQDRGRDRDRERERERERDRDRERNRKDRRRGSKDK